MSEHVKIMATLTARPGKTAELTRLLFGMIPACRSEPGNLRWDIWQDQGNPERFVLDELYRDGLAVAAHRETAHYQDYFGRINDLADRTALLLDPVKVA
jgi:quinol monooxygenase YgiN